MQARLTLAAVVLVGVALQSAREPGGIGQDAPAPAPAQPPATPPVPDEAAARNVLAAMAKAYVECSSYRDTGTVTTKFIGREMITKRAFKTAFVRGGSFRFEYADVDGYAAGKPYIVWTDGKSVKSWTHLNPGEETHFFLSMALAGATGVSGGSAHTVPRLLLPEKTSGWVLTDVVDPRCQGEEVVDGRDCLKIVTKHAGGFPITMWIDKETKLVRQLFQSHDFKDKGFSTEQTTTYKPEAGATIVPAELAFNPPEVSSESK